MNSVYHGVETLILADVESGNLEVLDNPTQEKGSSLQLLKV